MPSLLEDIEAEKHEFLLASGNLNPKKPWVNEVFTSSGYVARVLETVCNSCEEISSSLLGLLHRETSNLGKIREQGFPLTQKGLQFGPDSPKIIIKEVRYVAVCPACLPKLGFR